MVRRRRPHQSSSSLPSQFRARGALSPSPSRRFRPRSGPRAPFFFLLGVAVSLGLRRRPSARPSPSSGGGPAVGSTGPSHLGSSRGRGANPPPPPPPMGAPGGRGGRAPRA